MTGEDVSAWFGVDVPRLYLDFLSRDMYMGMVVMRICTGGGEMCSVPSSLPSSELDHNRNILCIGSLCFLLSWPRRKKTNCVQLFLWCLQGRSLIVPQEVQW